MFFRQAHSDHQPIQQYQLQAPHPQQATGACHCSNDSEGQHHGAGTTMMPSGCMQQHVLHRGLPPLGPGHHTTGGMGHVPATHQHHAASSHHTWQPLQHHQPPPQQQQHRSLEGDTAGRGLRPARLYSAFKASLMRHDQAFGPQPAATSSHPSNSSSQAGAAAAAAAVAAAAAAAGPSARGPGSYDATHMNPVAAQQQKQQQDGSQSMWHYRQHQEYQQQQQQQQQWHPPSYPQHQTQRGRDPHQAPPHQPYGCNTLRCAPTGSEHLECDEVMCNVTFPAPYIASRGAADAHPATAAPETAAAGAAATGGGGSTGWAAACGAEVDSSLYRTSTGRSSAESDRTVYHALHQQPRSSHSQRSLLGRGSRSSSSSGRHGQEEEDDDCMQVYDQLERCISSAGRRCGIAVMSVYTDINSPVALAQANALMARVKLPGGVSFVPVEPDFFLWRAATAWSFPAYSTVLASSYFQRLLVALPHLAQAAATAPSLQRYCRGTGSSAPASSGSDDRHVEATMRSIQVTCLYVALKVADQVHALGLLRFMLTAIGGNVHPVPLGDAELVEARLLDGLGWRLGPFFAEDDLDELGFDSDVWGALE